MKKIYRIAFMTLMIFAATQMEAQGSYRGKKILFPQVSEFNFSIVDSETTYRGLNIGASIGAGKFISNSFAVGAKLGYHYEEKIYKSQRFELSVLGRLYIFDQLFAGASIGYEWEYMDGRNDNQNYLPIELEAGYSFFIYANKLAFEPALYWKYSALDKYKQFGVKLGMAYYF